MIKSHKMKYYTTPMYYVNASPHLGHAYSTIVTDIFARFAKNIDQDVYFATGTDEHGGKVSKSAQNMNIDTKEFCDFYAKQFIDLATLLNIKYDVFSRTTDQRHHESAIYLWNKLQDNGYIYIGKYAGWYAIKDESFYNEDEIKDGLAPTGATVEWVEEETYFFRLSSFQDKLIQYYNDNNDFFWPLSRKNEIINMINAGLRDLSISRSKLSWGIPVPSDNNHVMYVWIDALASYITALGYPDNLDRVNAYMSTCTHVIGKEIAKFHAIYWPAMLMAADIALPKTIFSHGWLILDGKKMSKSDGNIINPIELISKYGVDRLRYALVRDGNLTDDKNFSEDTIKKYNNSELADQIGNLFQRTLSMIYNKRKGIFVAGNYDECELVIDAKNALDIVKSHLDNYAIHNALRTIVELARTANKYIADRRPWEYDDEFDTIIYPVLYAMRNIGILLQPFMPHSASIMLDQLLIINRDFDELYKPYKPNGNFTKPFVIFEKI